MPPGTQGREMKGPSARARKNAVYRVLATHHRVVQVVSGGQSVNPDGVTVDAISETYMNPAMQIQLALLNNNFRIESADDIKGGERFRLGVGLTITVYNNGTVLVQGRLKPKFAWTLRPLMRILPKHTSWRMAKEPAY